MRYCFRKIILQAPLEGVLPVNLEWGYPKNTCVSFQIFYTSSTVGKISICFINMGVSALFPRAKGMTSIT